MDYMEKIIEEFKDKAMFQAWGIVDSRLAKSQNRTLIHPCNMGTELLRELIPTNHCQRSI